MTASTNEGLAPWIEQAPKEQAGAPPILVAY